MISKKFLRPCDLSIILAFIPVIYISYIKKEYLLCILSLLLIITSILHHSFYKIGNIYHKLDKLVIWLLTVHLFIIAGNTRMFWIFLLTLSLLFLYVIHLSKNHTDESRDWNNILDLFPHMCVHYLAAVGIYYGIKNT